MIDKDILERKVQGRITSDFPMIHSIELAWYREFDSNRTHGTVIVYISRSIETNGGDGWTGFDSNDIDALTAALQDALFEDGALGLFDRMIVREAAGLSS